jgi:hypothetical protein
MAQKNWQRSAMGAPKIYAELIPLQKQKLFVINLIIQVETNTDRLR